MTQVAFLLSFPMMVVVFGCSSESSSPSQAGNESGSSSTVGPRPVAGSGAAMAPGKDRPAVVQSARIMPEPLTLHEPVSVLVEAQDPEGGPVRLKHQWYVDGEPLPDQTGPTLPAEVLTRGNLVSVQVTPMDAKGLGVPHRTPDVPVVNSPPKVTEIVFKPFPIRVGDRVMAEINGHDPDGDDVSYAFEWRRNGEVVEGIGDGGLDTSGFTRGDEIVLAVIPTDDIDDGAVQASDPVQVANSPPQITSAPPTQIPAGLYTYRVTATDRDGDALTYGLESGPPGMTIDPQTGVLQWMRTAEVVGTHPVRITVNDGQSEEPTVQEFSVVLNGQAGG